MVFMGLTLKNFVFVLAFLSCLLGSEIILAQQPFTRKISYLDGLPTDVIYDVFVDKSGLLYLGTDKGLITYDGVHFNRVAISDALGNAISSIQQDELGVIWCKNFANQLFYLSDNQLKEEKNVQALLRSTNANLVDFCIANNSKYVATQQSVYKFDGKKRILILDVSNDLNVQLSSMVFDKKNQYLYVSSGQSLYIYHKDKLIKEQQLKFEQKILEVFNHQLAYCTKALGKNCVVNGKNIDLKDSGLDKTFLNRLSATPAGLWLCTNKGLYQFNESEERFENGFLLNSRITDVVLDQEGNHWIGTLDEGLFLMPNPKIFEIEMPFNPKSIYTCIAKGPNGNYFVGTNTGKVNEISRSGQQVREYRTNWDNNIEFVNFAGDTILTNYGFFKIGNPSVIARNDYYGKYLEEDDQGNLLMAAPSFGGLLSKNIYGKPKFTSASQKYSILPYGKSQTKVLVFRKKRTRSLLFDPKKQEYYYGFIDGLFVFDKQGNQTEIRTSDNKSIVADDLLYNPDGTIWVATVQNGVFLLKNKKCILQISRKNGLSNNNCRRIAADKDGLWIITEDGFDYYDYKLNRVINAELNLCMKGIGINDLVSLNQIIALATNRGIYYFNKEIINQVIVPKLEITKFVVNERKINYAKEIDLNHNQNNININFKTIQFKSLGNYNYYYRLKGLNDKWQKKASKTENINFLALTPGTYQFQIKIEIGDRMTPVQKIDFTIQKPFWLQIWFLTITIFALIALLYAVYRWAELKTKKSEELKEQLALSQLTALRSQMNPHFIFNVLNAVQGLIYSNQKSKASDYLGKFSDLMRRILDTSDKNEVTIEKEFETIDLYVSLEKARFDNDFEYKISFPENIDLSAHTIPSMIIQPFVENAIKHGLMHKSGFKILEIKVELLGDVWCFTIDDNGIGRKASEFINQKIKKHISFAIKAIDNRVKLINKISDIAIDIEVIDKKATNNQSLGTRIKIYIPIRT